MEHFDICTLIQEKTKDEVAFFVQVKSKILNKTGKLMKHSAKNI